MSVSRPFALLAVALILAACAGPGATAAPTAAPATPIATATLGLTPEPPVTAPPTPTAVSDACADALPLKSAELGRLTISTDIPAFPPWWGGDAAEEYENEPESGSPWSESDFSAEPYSMEGFEGATAYAIAERMGFDPPFVDWIANPVFEQAFAPGPKPFDFHMAQVSIRPERAEAVDFSEPYFDSNQSLLALSGNPITSATSIDDLKGYLLAAAANTTSFELIDDVIQPTVDPRVYPDNATALLALSAGGDESPDGLIVDLGTAFYMRDAELADGKIVGQFGPVVQVDQVGAVLEKGSGLLPCLNQVILELKADGTLDEIRDEWINTGQEIPFLE